MSAVDHAHFHDVYWKDIDWKNPVHNMGDRCEYCGIDSGELVGVGHQNCCPMRTFFDDSWDAPATREHVRQEIKKALQREGYLWVEYV